MNDARRMEIQNLKDKITQKNKDIDELEFTLRQVRGRNDDLLRESKNHMELANHWRFKTDEAKKSFETAKEKNRQSTDRISELNRTIQKLCNYRDEDDKRQLESEKWM